MKNITRRDFIKKTSFAAGAIPFLGFPNPLFSKETAIKSEPLSVHIFSKQLQFIDDFRKLGEVTTEMGFKGVDLTVRPKGHVTPENVKTDLPKAIKELKKGGANCDLISTEIESAKRPFDVDIIKTAAENGVKIYRPNWFKYPEEISMEAAIEQYNQQLIDLSKLNETHGIIGAYQNHAGKTVGASIWEIKQILEGVNTKYFGAQYDIRHNMVEGLYSWENALRLIQKSIKSIVIKDFKYANINGVWVPVYTPIGEGMVDFKKYFGLLKSYQIKVPVSLHLEYDLGGAEHGKREISVQPEFVYDAMKRDLEKLQQLWKEA